MNEKIMIAMSGGVDSAVAAALCAPNASAAGVTMQHFAACGERDAEDAAALCALLGIPHFVAHLEKEFEKEVVLPFIAAYESGETPNPCVLCNKKIKFGALMDFAKQNGFDRIATGHYARIEHTESRSLIRMAKDTGKDQTYMLYSLTQDVLSRVELPLGGLTKPEVRELASELGFEVAQKEDSQDICFIPDGDYAAFIRRFTGKTPECGKFLSTDGRVLGTHQGQLHYTIGQRKGLGIALGAPAYVVAKSAEENTVTLGTNKDLFTTRLVAKNINFIPEDGLSAPRKLLAKVRYSQKATLARVEQTGEDELTVEFDTPQRAISKGQSLVLYEDDYLFGGGIICYKELL